MWDYDTVALQCSIVNKLFSLWVKTRLKGKGSIQWKLKIKVFIYFFLIRIENYLSKDLFRYIFDVVAYPTSLYCQVVMTVFEKSFMMAAQALQIYPWMKLLLLL